MVPRRPAIQRRRTFLWRAFNAAPATAMRPQALRPTPWERWGMASLARCGATLVTAGLTPVRARRVLTARCPTPITLQLAAATVSLVTPAQPRASRVGQVELILICRPTPTA